MLALASLALVGCGKSEPTTSTTGGSEPAKTSDGGEAKPAASNEPAEGWKRITSKSGGFTIDVPEAWSPVDSENPEFKAFMDKLQKSNPGMAASLSSQDNFELFVMDISDGSADDGFSDNINCIMQAGGPEKITDAVLESAGKEVVKQMPSKVPFTTEIIDLAGTRALRYKGTMTMNNPNGGEISTDILGTILVHNKQVFTFTISCGKGQQAGKMADFEKMMASLSLK